MIKEIKISFTDKMFRRKIKQPLVGGDRNVYALVIDFSKYPEASTLLVYATRADGTVVADEAYIDNTKYTYILTENMYSIEGTMTLRIVLSDGGEKILTVCELEFDVLGGLSECEATENSQASFADIYLRLAQKADKNELSEYARASLLEAIIPKGTASGKSITLNDHLPDSDLINYQVYGCTGGVGVYVATGEMADKYEIKLKVMGKNLFDPAKINSSTMQVENGNVYCSAATNDTGIKPSDFLKTAGLNPGDSITVSRLAEVINGAASSSSTGAISFTPKRNSNPTVVLISGSQSSNMVTIPNNFSDSTYKPLKFYGASDTSDGETTCIFSNIQIEKGDSTSEYEAYWENVADIYLDAPIYASEYIDYKEQKLVTATAETSVTLPPLTLGSGTSNIFAVSQNPDSINILYYQNIIKRLEEIGNALGI